MTNRKAKKFIFGGPLLFVIFAFVAVVFVAMISVLVRRPGGYPADQDIVKKISPQDLPAEERVNLLAGKLEESLPRADGISQGERVDLERAITSSPVTRKSMSEKERIQLLEVLNN